MSTTKEAAMSTPKVPFAIYTPDSKTHYLKIAVYGQPGVGKTTLAASAPRPLFINAESGVAALVGKDSEAVVTDISSVADLRKVYEFLSRGGHDFESVIIDSVSELQLKSMDNVLDTTGHDYPQQQDWGVSLNEIRKIIRDFRDLPMHVVCVFGERVRDDAITGSTYASPNLPGKLGYEIAGYFDVVGHMLMNPVRGKPGEYEHGMRVHMGPRWIAKDRTGTLPPVLTGDRLNIPFIIEQVQNAQRKGVTNVIDETIERVDAT